MLRVGRGDTYGSPGQDFACGLRPGHPQRPPRAPPGGRRRTLETEAEVRDAARRACLGLSAPLRTRRSHRAYRASAAGRSSFPRGTPSTIPNTVRSTRGRAVDVPDRGGDECQPVSLDHAESSDTRPAGRGPATFGEARGMSRLTNDIRRRASRRAQEIAHARIAVGLAQLLRRRGLHHQGMGVEEPRRLAAAQEAGKLNVAAGRREEMVATEHQRHPWARSSTVAARTDKVDHPSRSRTSRSPHCSDGICTCGSAHGAGRRNAPPRGRDVGEGHARAVPRGPSSGRCRIPPLRGLPRAGTNDPPRLPPLRIATGQRVVGWVLPDPPSLVARRERSQAYPRPADRRRARASS